MAATLAQRWSLLAKIAKARSDLVTDGTAFLALLDAAAAAADTESGPDIEDRLDEAEASIERTMASLQSAAGLSIRDICRGYGGNPDAEINDCLRFILRRMREEKHWITERDITRNSFSPNGGNTGDGWVYRCTKDYDGIEDETGYIQDTEIRCIADANIGTGGASGRERFVIRGARDDFPYASPFRPGGKILTEAEIFSLSPEDSVFANCAFLDGTGEAASTSEIDNWTVATGTIGTDIRRSALVAPGTGDANCFRAQRGAATGRYVEFLGNATLAQARSVSGARLPATGPIFVGMIVKASTGVAFNGNAYGKWGDLTAKTVAHGSLSAGWNLVQLATFDSVESFYDSYDEADVTLTIGVSGHSAGSLSFGGIVIGYPVYYNGSYYMVISGQANWSASSDGDRGEWSDSSADTGEIQTMLGLDFGFALRGVADASQVTASGGRTLTFSTSPDTITASSGDFASDGYKAGMSLTVAGTSSNDGTYTITAVTATTITVDSTLAAGGPLSSTATLDATATYADAP